MTTKIIPVAILIAFLIGFYVTREIDNFKKEMKTQREKKAAIKNARWSQIFAMTDLKGETK